MGWVGRILKPIPFHPLVMGRDTLHSPRLIQGPSSLALDTSKDEAATAVLGNLCQGLNTLTGNNFFTVTHTTPPSGSGKPFPHVQALVCKGTASKREVSRGKIQAENRKAMSKSCETASQRTAPTLGLGFLRIRDGFGTIGSLCKNKD